MSEEAGSQKEFETGVARGTAHWLKTGSGGDKLAAFERGVVQGTLVFLEEAGLSGRPGAQALETLRAGVAEGLVRWLDMNRDDVLKAVASAARGR
jgi:hypothetical protein